MQERLDNEHKWLSLDYPCEIVYDGRIYGCATTLYMTLTHPQMADRMAKPTTGPQAWRMADDPHDEEAMRVALTEKFKNKELADKLLAEEFVLYIGDDGIWCITDEDTFVGNNLCGIIMEDLRDKIAHDREMAARDKSYMLTGVWPGHVAKSIYGDDVMWLRIPNMEVRGTLSTIIPKDDIVESTRTITRGKYKGRHYLDIYLSQESYPIAHHDEHGHIQTLTVAPRYSREQLYNTFVKSRARDVERRRAKRKSDARLSRRRNNPGAVAVIHPGVWPTFSYEIHPRPDESLGCELIMINDENKNQIDISVPVICDVMPTANEYTIACDPTGIELAVECAIADGAIWPALMRYPNGKTSFVQFDKQDKYAWLAFNVSPDIVIAQNDKAYFDYLQKGRREIGQVMSDWRSRMPSREPHGTIQDTIARICRLANEDERTKRKELVEMWLDQGIYGANGL